MLRDRDRENYMKHETLTPVPASGCGAHPEL